MLRRISQLQTFNFRNEHISEIRTVEGIKSGWLSQVIKSGWLSQTEVVLREHGFQDDVLRVLKWRKYSNEPVTLEEIKMITSMTKIWQLLIVG